MHTRSNKKKKWKRREERHYDRVNARRSKLIDGDGVSKKYANPSSSATDTIEKKSEQHENKSELLTRERLTLKPFRKRKAVDAMSWPSIQMPESIKNKVSDGIRKITRQAKNIFNSVELSQPSYNAENSRKQHRRDEVILVDQDVTDRPMVREKPPIDVDKEAANATTGGKRSVVASDRLKSLKAWLDTSTKSRALAGKNKVRKRYLNFYCDLARHVRVSKILCQGFKSDNKLNMAESIRSRLSSLLRKNRRCGEDIPAASKSSKTSRSVFLETSDRRNKITVPTQRDAYPLPNREHCDSLIVGSPAATDIRNESAYQAIFGNSALDDEHVNSKLGNGTRSRLLMPPERKGEGTYTPDPNDTSHDLATYQTAFEHCIVDVENISSQSDKGAARARLLTASEGYDKGRDIFISGTPEDCSHDLEAYQTALEYPIVNFESIGKESDATRSRMLMGSDVYSGDFPATVFKPPFLQPDKGQGAGKYKARAIGDGEYRSAENQALPKQRIWSHSGLAGNSSHKGAVQCPSNHSSYIIDGTDSEGDFTFGISGSHTARRRRKLLQLSPDLANDSKRSEFEGCMQQTSHADYNDASPYIPFRDPFVL